MLWFFILMSIYVANLAMRRFYFGRDYFTFLGIPRNLAALSGLSLMTGAAGKRHNGRERSGRRRFSATEVAVANHRSGLIYDLTTDDSGVFQLWKFQLLVVLLVALTVYGLIVFESMGHFAFKTTQDLPDVNTAIASFLGDGEISYTGKMIFDQIRRA